MTPEPHDHIAAAYKGRTGSPYQTFPKPRRASAWLWFSTGALVAFASLLLCVLSWAHGR